MTNLEVSCPCYGKKIVLTTIPIIGDDTNFMFEKLCPNVKRYSFNGDGICTCGKTVMAYLTVTGGWK